MDTIGFTFQSVADRAFLLVVRRGSWGMDTLFIELKIHLRTLRSSGDPDTGNPGTSYPGDSAQLPFGSWLLSLCYPAVAGSGDRILY
jgi:hypothetical protein